ncbi:hypothetical protein ACFQDF_29510 [Ectobacillus funiculus]
MADCCDVSSETKENFNCPLCKTKGKSVEVITLKSLLTADALKRLEVGLSYNFCPAPECDVIYFNSGQQVFLKTDIKVPIFQKDTKTMSLFVIALIGQGNASRQK